MVINAHKIKIGDSFYAKFITEKSFFFLSRSFIYFAVIRWDTKVKYTRFTE